MKPLTDLEEKLYKIISKISVEGFPNVVEIGTPAVAQPQESLRENYSLQGDDVEIINTDIEVIFFCFYLLESFYYFAHNNLQLYFQIKCGKFYCSVKSVDKP